jgi:PST family polysaccharide transporter
MSIARKAVVGALWTSGSNYLSQGVGMLAVYLLGRLLLKEEYGLFATANSIIQFVFILSAFSFNLSIIQTQEQREHLYSTAMLLNLALGILSLLFTLVAIAGYLLFRALTTTEIAVIMSLSLVNILNLLGQHFDAILQRNLQFRTVSLIAFVMNLANPLTAVTCAWAGLGVWSLVAGQGAGAIVFLAGGWLFAGWSISFTYSRETARWFLSQGFKYLSSRSLEVVYTELDRLVIKRFSDYQQVGIYDRAVLAARYPARVVTPAVINVALPVYSKLEANGSMLSDAYAKVSFFLMRALIPFGLIFFLAPEAFMITLLGSQWQSAAPILRILAVYAVLHPFVENFRVLLYSLGRPQDVAVVRVIQILIYVPLLYVLTLSSGITGAAIAFVVSIVITLIAFIYKVRTFIDIRALRSVVLPLALSVLVVLVYSLLPIPHFAHAWSSLLVQSIIITALYILFEVAFEGRAIRSHLEWFRSTLRTRTSVDSEEDTP